jgi:hypothetical protein
MLSNIPKLLKNNSKYTVFFVTKQHVILLEPNYLVYNWQNAGSDSIVGVTTHCGLKGKEIEPSGCEIFRIPPDRF